MPLPEVIVAAGPAAVEHFLEFFAAQIANDRTRAAYGRAAGRFLAWCGARGLGLRAIAPLHVAAYIRTHPGSAPTVKQHLAAIRSLCDWLVVQQVLPANPAAAVRGPKHVVTKGATPVLTPAETRALLDGIDTGTRVGVRDLALLSVLVYSFARVSAARFGRRGSRRTCRTGDAGARAADRRSRVAEDDEAVRPDVGRGLARRDRAHRDLKDTDENYVAAFSGDDAGIKVLRQKMRTPSRERRLALFERGNDRCPLCLTSFTRKDVEEGRATLEHVPAKVLGVGDPIEMCLTCLTCNREAGRVEEAAAGARGEQKLQITVEGLDDAAGMPLAHTGYATVDGADRENREATVVRELAQPVGEVAFPRPAQPRDLMCGDIVEEAPREIEAPEVLRRVPLHHERRDALVDGAGAQEAR